MRISTLWPVEYNPELMRLSDDARVLFLDRIIALRKDDNLFHELGKYRANLFRVNVASYINDVWDGSMPYLVLQLNRLLSRELATVQYASILPSQTDTNSAFAELNALLSDVNQYHMIDPEASRILKEEIKRVLTHTQFDQLLQGLLRKSTQKSNTLASKIAWINALIKRSLPNNE
jgi:hypothetical protein